MTNYVVKRNLTTKYILQTERVDFLFNTLREQIPIAVQITEIPVSKDEAIRYWQKGIGSFLMNAKDKNLIKPIVVSNLVVIVEWVVN